MSPIYQFPLEGRLRRSNAAYFVFSICGTFQYKNPRVPLFSHPDSLSHSLSLSKPAHGTLSPQLSVLHVSLL